MNIFNRKELFMTMDLQKFNTVTGIINNAEIPYRFKIVNAVGIRPGRIGAFGTNTSQMLQYYIYVHKKDYDKARELIRNYTIY